MQECETPVERIETPVQFIFEKYTPDCLVKQRSGVRANENKTLQRWERYM